MPNNFFNSLSKCFLIAEIGVNHNGDMDLAFKLIDAAKDSGADAVKFQTYKVENFVSFSTPKVDYQNKNTSADESHYEMISKLQLSYEDHIPLKDYCEKNDLMFLSTPYDIESANFLLNLNVECFKTSSADLVDIQLQHFIANTRKPSIVSIGMATIEEIKKTMKIYKNANNNNVAILHCVSNYPCADESINMRVLNTLKEKFDITLGFSDHSVGNEAAILSLGFGAKIIEKHFTLDKNLEGPDHRASSTPDEFKSLVKSIRRTELMLGSPDKFCQKEEMQMASTSRKSFHLACTLNKGQIIEIKHLKLMRPGNGILSYEIEKLIGKKINKNLKEGDQLSWKDITL